MAITVSGIGSGLDVENIVTQLMAVERQPLLRLASREAGLQAQISSVGTLKSVLAGFRTAVEKLADPETFNAATARVSDPTVLSVTADPGAAPGTLAVEVTRLAQNHRLASEARADTATVGGAPGDKLGITVGTDTLTLDLSTAKTLAEIRDLINADTTGVGVSASLLDEAGDGSAQRLILNARASGFENRLQLSFGGSLTADSLGFTTLNRDGAGTVLTDLTDLNASLSIDGFTLARSTNTVDDAIAGLTLNLTAVGTASISVGQNDAAIVSALTGMVDSYNTLKTQLDGLSQGVLSGDSLTRNVLGGVRSVMNQAFSGFGDFASLAELGITTTREGDMQLDSLRLTRALADNRTGVAGFFSSETGFAAALSTALDGYLDDDGIVDARIDGLNNRVRDLQSQQARWELRLVGIEDRLRTQFTALDSLVAQLTTTSTFLAQQLDNLPGAVFRSDRR